jgi:hypothetical protein
LLVDGPGVPDHDPFIRYPALPYFFERLSPDHCIIFDDIRRKNEKVILSEWEKSYDIHFQIRGDYAIRLSGQYFVPYL